MIIALFSQKEI